MGKIGWQSKDGKVIKVVCDQCLKGNRRINLRSQDHWVYVGEPFEIYEKLDKEHKYIVKCPKGHEIEIDSIRWFPEGRDFPE